MPVPGRKPKPAGQAVNRARPAHDWTEVEDVPFTGPHPILPESRKMVLQFGEVVEVPLSDMTRDWWDTVCAMPHCRLWTPSDWQFALATALVADAFFNGHGPSATELARREKVLGTTVDYRMGLRIRYVEPKSTQEVPAGVANLDDFRDL